ncbi:hypothetical protein VFC49_08890 [Thermococcus sp. SY098]|uniref:hypothetical protein n=1 Tax=Thermococcus sp. SY098 TaxID=3111325 RepID=UPI002D76D8E2|nr:hypothetical protein [Thermococcus sp. SY098]WRS52165.1 hypothetical protein VFC49_08890 [Thermococcus sp. SY098]
MVGVEDIEYVYGKNGKIKAVIAPIDLWKKIKAKFFDPSEFRGIYKDLKVDFEKELKG